MRASDALLIAKNSLIAPNEVSQLSSNLQRSRLGPMRSTVTRKSEVKNNGSILQVEERKEDSYIHPAFKNSVAFLNISGIFGYQTLNNHGLMSLRDDSFANEYEDLNLILIWRKISTEIARRNRDTQEFHRQSTLFMKTGTETLIRTATLFTSKNAWKGLFKT